MPQTERGSRARAPTGRLLTRKSEHNSAYMGEPKNHKGNFLIAVSLMCASLEAFCRPHLILEAVTVGSFKLPNHQLAAKTAPSYPSINTGSANLGPNYLQKSITGQKEFSQFDSLFKHLLRSWVISSQKIIQAKGETKILMN